MARKKRTAVTSSLEGKAEKSMAVYSLSPVNHVNEDLSAMSTERMWVKDELKGSCAVKGAAHASHLSVHCLVVPERLWDPVGVQHRAGRVLV